MKAKKIAFTGIPVTDIKRARAFYEGVLVLEAFRRIDDGGWIEYDIGPDTLAIGSVGDNGSHRTDGTSVAIEVEDFDEAIKTPERRGRGLRRRGNRKSVLSHGGGAGSRRQQNHHSQTEISQTKKGSDMIKEVAFVAIAVSDEERARKFYQETLELKPTTTAMDGAWVEYDLGPTTIGVGCHPAWKPSRDGTTVAFEVDDIDATIAKLKERGVAFDMEKMETPVCWMAQFRDPGRQQTGRP